MTELVKLYKLKILADGCPKTSLVCKVPCILNLPPANLNWPAPSVGPGASFRFHPREFKVASEPNSKETCRFLFCFLNQHNLTTRKKPKNLKLEKESTNTQNNKEIIIKTRVKSLTANTSEHLKKKIKVK